MTDRPWLERAALRGPHVLARAERAVALWSRGAREHASGDPATAFATLELAHDLVTDLPGGHREAHERLLPVETELGRTRDVRVGRLLLALAPLGIFTLLAWYFRATEDYRRFDGG